MNAPDAAAAITDEIVASHGLNHDEYRRVLEILGREPSLTELGIFSVMWSEHCSYKTTRKHLKKLPTGAPHVICGPGENAGVIDIGNGQAAVFKMESHNHPSFIEPFQGAATGVGGILRDVFTMGARPVANMNALRFGDPSHPKTRHLVSGVVAGIGAYGNCVGVPTVGGACNFHPGYNGNILVNAMTVGIADADKIFYSAAAGVGNPVVYVGSKTGRDGIHAATMASAAFGTDVEAKRPTVQVGDPFTEKLLIEACLELMATDAIVAIQDMGAAGLTSSSVEMAGKGKCGIELNLDKVPMREEGMTPYEIMLSESQERMLMVLKPGREKIAEEIFGKWELDIATIGTITDTGRLVVKMGGEVFVDLPVAPVSEEAPVYDRPYEIKRPAASGQWPDDDIPAAKHWPLNTALLSLLGSPDLCSKRWIWEQYDHMVMNDTVARPGGDAAIVRVHGTNKALAMTTDCTPRYCFADPVLGGRQAVAESWRNLTAVGATPLAITNCLNFGNPERPEIMGQIVGCLEGMSQACRALDYPVVSGNVSLYNETEGASIPPTPVIGGVGILKNLNRRVGMFFTEEGLDILLIGATKGHLGASLYQEIFFPPACDSSSLPPACGGDVRGGVQSKTPPPDSLRSSPSPASGRGVFAPPPVDLAAEKRNGDFVRSLITKGALCACHDISDGGLLVALAEMTFAKEIGATVAFPPEENLTAFAFGEDQARYVLAAEPEKTAAILNAAAAAGVPGRHVGKTGGAALSVEGAMTLPVAGIRAAWEQWLPGFIEA